jgi:Gluconate 2-dehydrogenase subunit 3
MNPSATSDVDVLTVLANAIIPPDARDAGAAAVDAGPRLAERMRDSPHAALYHEGLRTAQALCAEQFGRLATGLTPSELYELMQQVAASHPAFFRQLRLDTTTLYLSDPAVWTRIGFPGPSIETGGHPDFDRRQSIRAWRVEPGPAETAAPAAAPGSTADSNGPGEPSGRIET